MSGNRAFIILAVCGAALLPAGARAEEKPIVVTASKLAEVYATDPKAFDKDYKDKLVEIEGVVDEPKVQDVNSKKYFVMFQGFTNKGATIGYKVRCELTQSLDGLKSGQRVRIQGTCRGFRMFLLAAEIADCKLLKKEYKPTPCEPSATAEQDDQQCLQAHGIHDNFGKEKGEGAQSTSSPVRNWSFGDRKAKKGTRLESNSNRVPFFSPNGSQGQSYNVRMKLLFLHGWHSVPGGVKPTFLKDHGHEVVNPALPHDDFAEAVRIAQAEFDQHRPQVVVGSSRGGAVAMNINSGEARLVLLCPAWKKYGSARTVKPGTVILHSRADDVVPFADSEELARSSGATSIEVGTDHRLADPEPLAAMLRACEKAGR